MTTAGREAILPVNYSVVDRSVVFRTAPGSGPAEVTGTEVVFEVDHVDEALSQGWSVLVRGRGHRVEDPEAAQDLAEQVYSGPWPGTTTAACGCGSTWTGSVGGASTYPEVPSGADGSVRPWRSQGLWVTIAESWDSSTAHMGRGPG